jgi:hypothetical protein
VASVRDFGGDDNEYDDYDDLEQEEVLSMNAFDQQTQGRKHRFT